MCGRYGRRVNHQERLSKEKLGMTSRDPERFSYEDWRCRSEKDSTRSEHRVQQRMFSEGCRILQRHPYCAECLHKEQKLKWGQDGNFFENSEGERVYFEGVRKL